MQYRKQPNSQWFPFTKRNGSCHTCMTGRITKWQNRLFLLFRWENKRNKIRPLKSDLGAVQGFYAPSLHHYWCTAKIQLYSSPPKFLTRKDNECQTNSRHIVRDPQQVEKAMRTTIPHKSAVIATCGLLERSHFCSIANNSMPRKASRSGVVICLKNRTFAVSQTTHRMKSSWLLMFLSIKRRLFSLWCQHKTNTLLKHEVQNKPNLRLINFRKTNNSRTHQLTNWKTHKLIHSNLKSLSFILQYHSNFRFVLAEI